MVQERVEDYQRQHGSFHEPIVTWKSEWGHLLPEDGEDDGALSDESDKIEKGDASADATVLHGWTSLKFAFAAQIAWHIRSQVFQKLHYTLSAGISMNKPMSKICSAMYKPNKQATVRYSARNRFLSKVPFRKLPYA